jgi:hypothetical protein
MSKKDKCVLKVSYQRILRVFMWCIVNGTLARDFRPLFFVYQTTSPGPWYTGESLFEYGFEFAKIINKLGCTAVPLTSLCNQLFSNIFANIHTLFIRKSDSAAHGTAVSMTPLCKYDTAVIFVGMFFVQKESKNFVVKRYNLPTLAIVVILLWARSRAVRKIVAQLTWT